MSRSVLQTMDRLKTLLTPFGALEAQEAEEWTGDIELPAVLAAYYAQVGPTDLEIDTLGDPFTFYPLSRLWDIQAGYRWNTVSGARLVDWNDEWVVVATQGEDPFILDALTGEVLTAPGENGWLDREAEPEVTFPNLAVMTEALAAVGAAYAATEDPFTEDWAVSPELARDVTERLEQVLGDAGRARLVARKFGYPA
jgi:hypothetical protein